MSQNVEIKMVEKEFDLNQGITLPMNTTYYKIEDKHLWVAPDKATWITTTDLGKKFFDYFKNGYSIRAIIDEMTPNGIHLDMITSELRDFLINVERKGFLEQTICKEEHVETSLQLFITNRCNIQCCQCYMDAGTAKPNELTTSEFISILDEFSTFHRTKVVFSGGEPLTRPDFFKLAERAKMNKLKFNSLPMVP